MNKLIYIINKIDHSNTKCVDISIYYIFAKNKMICINETESFTYKKFNYKISKESYFYDNLLKIIYE